MPDQADNLRQLMGSAASPCPRAAPGPPMIVVAGGRAGVGATTVAVNLAAVLADHTERVLVVDAVDGRGNLAEAAGIAPADIEYSLSDVLAGRCSAAAAIARGPAGAMVLAGGSQERGARVLAPRSSLLAPMSRTSSRVSRHAQQRLLAELQLLSGDVDLVVVDIGSGLTPWTRRLWLRAQLVVLVTAADAGALLDTYATVKLSVADAIGPELRLLVNACDGDQEAAAIHQSLANACQQFLGRKLPALPALPRHDAFGSGEVSQVPRVWEAPDTSFGRAALWLGRAVSDVLSTSAVLSSAAAAA